MLVHMKAVHTAWQRLQVRREQQAVLGLFNGDTSDLLALALGVNLGHRHLGRSRQHLAAGKNAEHQSRYQPDGLNTGTTTKRLLAVRIFKGSEHNDTSHYAGQLDDTQS